MSKNIHQKKGGNLVKTIEKKYGVNLGYSSDEHLHSLLKREGVPSLYKLLKLASNR
jgi:hypothetical protein